MWFQKLVATDFYKNSEDRKYQLKFSSKFNF
jgi:hypothetical protein